MYEIVPVDKSNAIFTVYTNKIPDNNCDLINNNDIRILTSDFNMIYTR